MQKTKQISSVVMLMLWDFFSMSAALLFSLRINYWSAESNLLFFHIPTRYKTDSFIFEFIFMATILFVVLNFLFGCYFNTLKHFGIADTIRLVFSTLTFTALFFIFNNYFPIWKVWDNHQQFETKVIVVMALLLFLFTLIGRSSVRLINETGWWFSKISHDHRKNVKSKRILIFGAGEAGLYLFNKLKMHPEDGLQPIVFIDDDTDLIGRKIHGIKVIGGSSKLGETIEKYNIEEVIVAIPSADKKLLEYILDVCREGKCQIRRFGSIDDVELSSAKVTDINLEELLRRDSVHLNMQVVRDFVEDKTILVTGGAGSIGSEICRQVLSFGCKKLIVFDIHENGLFFIENELKPQYPGKVELRLGSIRDRVRLDEVFTEFSPELVFHAAAHKHVPMMEYSPREAIKNNVMGTINTAQAAILHHVEKFILISTDKAVNPTNIMGASKRIAERAIQLMDGLSDTDFSAVRFGNVLGSNGSVVPFFQKQIESGGPVTVTHPDIKRYFMTIPEAVQLVLEAGAMANGGEIFVLNMGEPVKIYDLACDLIRLSGYEPNVDIEITFTGLRPGEKLFEEISLKNEDASKTPNDKIYIMKPMGLDQTTLSSEIKQLEEAAMKDSINTMFDRVKVLVPTFHHNPGENQPKD